jgi:aminoglycoside phosphotransferase (APT) family kinase protein
MNREQLFDAPFAYGRTAEIFAWPDGRVLKLFRSGWSEAGARYEAEKAEAVYAAGLPVPAIYDVIQVNGRFGILYEHIAGMSLTSAFQQKPWTLLSLARLLADLHLEMHQYRLPQLPSLRERLSGCIQGNGGMPAEIRRRLLELITTLPDGEGLAHGDFHPENIFITGRGPIILDWMDATRGHSLGDVARTSLLLRQAALPPDIPGRRFIELIRGLFHHIYLRRYFERRVVDKVEWRAWQTVIAAARLAEDIPEERDRLINLVRSGLELREEKL